MPDNGRCSSGTLSRESWKREKNEDTEEAGTAVPSTGAAAGTAVPSTGAAATACTARRVNYGLWVWTVD